MKQLILIVALALSINAYAQDDKTVTLVVSGSGKTQDEAKQNALRSAIEQAFGAFISSKTEILNDSLVKDEMVSVANGNIQKYEIISEVQIPSGAFASTLNATVSITKLNSFAESKGVIVEFQGALFGANLKQQKLNEEAELKSIINLCEVSDKILSSALDYSIQVNEPTKIKGSEMYEIPLVVTAKPNINFVQFITYFKKNIDGISMSLSERQNYHTINKDIYCLFFNNFDKRYFFRNPKTAVALQNFFLKSNKYLHNFEINSNIDRVLGERFARDLGKNYDMMSFHSSFPNFGFFQYSPGEIIIRRTVESKYMLSSSWVYYDGFRKLKCKNNYFLEDKNYYQKTASEYIEQKSEYSIPYEIQKNHIGNFEYYKIGEDYVHLEERVIIPIGVFYSQDESCFFKYNIEYTEEQISKLTNISVKKRN